MPPQATLLCIHREPAQLNLLKQQGYELLTAANGHEGLRLFMSQPVDAIVLEYHLGLLDGVTVAAEIKQVRPKVPIVMLIDHMELPDGALSCVDALVARSDGPHFLLATVHFILNVKPAQGAATKLSARTPSNRLHASTLRRGSYRRVDNGTEREIEARALPFSPRVWKSIRNGTIQF